MDENKSDKIKDLKVLARVTLEQKAKLNHIARSSRTTVTHLLQGFIDHIIQVSEETGIMESFNYTEEVRNILENKREQK